jgi:hypothetical protein
MAEARVLFLEGRRIFLLPPHPDLYEDPLSLPPNGYQDFFPRDEVARA